MSVRRAAAHLPSRSVHLRIVPRPANLSESREMLRVLQRFGDISTYKHLRYEYHNPADNVALAIYRTPDGAQQALNASPLRFALERHANPAELSYAAEEAEQDPASLPRASSADNLSEMTRPSKLMNRALSASASASVSASASASASAPAQTPTTPTPMPFSAPASRATTTKWFQVTVDRSRAVHQDFVQRQPLWKQFTPMKSMAQEDLAKVVPHPGLSDVTKRPPHAHRTPSKVLKSMSKWVEHGMPSLRGLWEEAQAQPRSPRRP
ncbi:uncharacterized protein EKO05_0003657 [Ascochyta rabiei]|uniref:Uncharacterized protein n=1 Tax=Didymella rabiei TaxID=5454 RepID=A0A162YVX3_DIDRA|nr:uncharacterized protein EKO05_0003657 [Ascochyta rabiei]KZM20257.1 hypothetical protein ST47_g8611 [Ascochyta rabiei]UPX13131.1 hypothetical protein EKO05_0003657 [Ascochyta rabiei]